MFFDRSNRRQKRALRPTFDVMEEIKLQTAVPLGLAAPQPSAFTLNGSAALTSSGVRLTNTFWQSSSLWYSPLETPSNYTARFTFSLAPPGGGHGWADGFTFAVANAATTSKTAIGADGGGLGYRGAERLRDRVRHALQLQPQRPELRPRRPGPRRECRFLGGEQAAALQYRERGADQRDDHRQERNDHRFHRQAGRPILSGSVRRRADEVRFGVGTHRFHRGHGRG